MKFTRDLLKIVLTITFLIFVLSTCTKGQRPSINETPDFVDTLKKEYEKLDLSYKEKMQKLQVENDSLKGIVKEKKQILSSYRFKAEYLETELENTLADTSLSRDRLREISEQYIEVVHKKDTACDSTIISLETVVENQDSVIQTFSLSNDNLRRLYENEEIRTDLLKAELDNSKRDNRKLKRRNRLLVFGATALSAITTTILITKRK